MKNEFFGERGFTLIEVLLFGTIFTVVSIAFLSILVAITRVETSQTSVTEVNQQGQFLMQSFQRYIENASLIQFPTSTPSSTLVLRMPDSASDPTTIYLDASGVVWVEESSSPPEQLTSSKVNITALSFSKRSLSNARDAVDVSFSMAYQTVSPQQKFSQSLQSTFARTGPASFSTDILPPAGNSLRLGVQNGDISSIDNTLFFSGPNAGIGTFNFNPSGRLSLYGGGLRFADSPVQPTCDSGHRGLFWVALASGTSTADAVSACLRTAAGGWQWQQYAAGSGNTPPAVSSISPSSATSGASVSISSITGANFASGAAVKISRTGSADITGAGFSVTNSSTIAGGTFDLTGAATGTWNVVVTNGDGQSGQLTNGFTVNAPAAPWLDPAWAYREKITVQGSQVSSTQSNFPVYVNLANMQTGFFTNVRADGGDIRVTKADAVTEEPREVVTINTSAQTGELHFKADSISNATNTVFYVYYGNPSAAEPLPGAADGKYNVWDSNFKGVYHHDEISGNALDATSNANNLTATTVSGHINYGVAAEVGNGETLNQAAPAYFQRASTLIGSTDISASMWVHLSSNNMNGTFFHNGNVTGNGDGFSLGVGNTSFDNTGNNLILLLDAVAWENTGVAIGTGWHYVALTRSSSDSIWRFYIDGAAAGPTSIGNNPSTPTANFAIGYDVSGAPRMFGDTVDESEFSATARSSQWIKTEYNNQSSPSTFYAVGAQETH